MKKFYMFMLSIFALIWFSSFIVFISEPHYLSQIKNHTNILSLFNSLDYPNYDDPEITKHWKFTWQKEIQKVNSFIFELKDLSQNPLKISVLSGAVSYKLFYQNMEFDSIFSPPQYIFLDSLSSMWPWEEFSCIKVAEHYFDLQQGEICKYIGVNVGLLWYPEAYSNLYLEITAFSSAWALIDIRR